MLIDLLILFLRQIQTYDRSLIFDRFSYNPNFRGLNPYELVVNSQSRPFSSFYDFVSKPGSRQQSIFSRFQSIPHQNFFPKTQPFDENLEESESLLSDFHYSELYDNHQPVDWSPARDFEKEVLYQRGVLPQVKDDNLYLEKDRVDFNSRRQVYYMSVSIFWRLVFKLYSLVFQIFFSYLLLWYYCYKQLFFLIFLILFIRLYFYSIQYSFYEYRLMLLEYKNFLIYTKMLYIRIDNLEIPENNFQRNLLRFFPSLYNQPRYILSEKYYAHRRFLFFKIFKELPFIFFFGLSYLFILLVKRFF